MKICPNCNLEISKANNNYYTPFLGASDGYLSDGSRLCYTCLTMVHKINVPMAYASKKYTLAQMQEAMNTKLPEKEKTPEEERSLANTERLLAAGIDAKHAFFGRRELKELSNVLFPAEQIKSVISGYSFKSSGILVATDMRVVFVHVGIIYGIKIEDFGLDKITSLDYESGFLSASIKIIASGNTAKIEKVNKAEGKEFCDVVRQSMAVPKTTSVTTSTPPKDDMIEKLEKLAKLKDAGILTQEEFDTEKRKLLNS